MNICITAQGPNFSSRFEPHFARAPYFVFYDASTGQTDAIRNGCTVNDTKIGQNVVKLLVFHSVHAVVTGHVGENAQKLLKSSGIALHVWQGEGTVREAVRAMMPDSLRATRRKAGSGTGVKTAKGGLRFSP